MNNKNNIITIENIKDLDRYHKLDLIMTKAREINELMNSLEDDYGMYSVTIYSGKIDEDTTPDKFYECKVNIGIEQGLENISKMLNSPMKHDNVCDDLKAARVVYKGMYFVDLYYEEEEKK